MLTMTHDYGWGPEWPMKVVEQSIIHDYLAPLIASPQRIVVINSTWYGQYQHAQTLRWLRNNDWDQLVLVALIDSAIPNATWFEEFDRPVLEVGGYDNSHYISFWAEVADRYIEPYHQHNISQPFMCLNRKPHWHRRKFYQEMQQAGVVDRGLVSLGGEGTEPAVKLIQENVGDNNLAPNGQKIHHGIPNDITSLGDLSNWQRHFLNVVTETIYDISRNHFVSEKIFKPILGHRPFLVYDPDGATSWLRSRGFESYTNDFKDITDLDLSQPENIAPFLAVLSDQGPGYWQQKYLDLLPKISYNLQRFQQFIAQQRQHIKRGIQCPT